MAVLTAGLSALRNHSLHRVSLAISNLGSCRGMIKECSDPSSYWLS